MDELVAVADLVTDVLAAAGIRSTFDSGPGSEGRAYLIIDDGDNGRGVYVTWTPAEGEPRASGGESVTANAVERLQRVLRAAGIDAEETDPDFYPYYLEILRVPGPGAGHAG
ncbi:hypothetical protein AB0B28_02135 [Glycomyces sp. NPDC046736]|uniref:hypothetical protein n=1 Tax=Glycomyces sp. NPDC046736 TaxID=3155615 RepID=UPI0033CB30BF